MVVYGLVVFSSLSRQDGEDLKFGRGMRRGMRYPLETTVQGEVRTDAYARQEGKRVKQIAQHLSLLFPFHKIPLSKLPEYRLISSRPVPSHASLSSHPIPSHASLSSHPIPSDQSQENKMKLQKTPFPASSPSALNHPLPSSPLPLPSSLHPTPI